MTFLKLIIFDFKITFKNKTTIFYTLAYPIILTLIFGYLFSATFEIDKTTSSYDYFAITMLIFFVLGYSITTVYFLDDAEYKASNQRLLFSPTPPLYIVFSRIIARVIVLIIYLTLAVILLKLFLHVNFGTNLFKTLIIFYAEGLFACLLGVLLSLLPLNTESIMTILNILLMIFAILGGGFFPIDSLGDTFEKLSYISPQRWVTLSLFQTIYDGSSSLYVPTIIVLISSSLFILVLIKILFRKEKLLA